MNIQDKLKEFDLKAEYNEKSRNYDIISTYPDYKSQEYTVLSCQEDGFYFDDYIYFSDDSEPFYTYVVNLQSLKADEKYKDTTIAFDGFNTVIDLKSDNEDIKRQMVIIDMYNNYEVKEVITEEEFVAVMNEINKIEKEEGLER